MDRRHKAGDDGCILMKKSQNLVTQEN